MALQVHQQLLSLTNSRCLPPSPDTAPFKCTTDLSHSRILSLSLPPSLPLSPLLSNSTSLSPSLSPSLSLSLAITHYRGPQLHHQLPWPTPTRVFRWSQKADIYIHTTHNVLQCVAVCCSVLLCCKSGVLRVANSDENVLMVCHKT